MYLFSLVDFLVFRLSFFILGYEKEVFVSNLSSRTFKTG